MKKLSAWLGSEGGCRSRASCPKNWYRPSVGPACHSLAAPVSILSWGGGAHPPGCPFAHPPWCWPLSDELASDGGRGRFAPSPPAVLPAGACAGSCLTSCLICASILRSRCCAACSASCFCSSFICASSSGSFLTLFCCCRCVIFGCCSPRSCCSCDGPPVGSVLRVPPCGSVFTLVSAGGFGASSVFTFVCASADRCAAAAAGAGMPVSWFGMPVRLLAKCWNIENTYACCCGVISGAVGI